MSDTHQPTSSEPSSQATSTTATSSNGAEPPPAAFYEAFADKQLAADPRLHRFASGEELAKSYIALEHRFGIPPERRIDLPEDMANDEQMREAVWSRLGLPGTPEGYNLKLAEGASAEDTQLLGSFLGAAHKAGVPTPQAKAMLEWWVGESRARLQASNEAFAQRKADGEAELRKAFGNAYDDRMREAANILKRYDPEGKTTLTAEMLTTVPHWTQMLIRMSDRMAEPEGGLGGLAETEATERPLTPAQAQGKLNEFNLDQAKQQALHDAKHPAHAAVLAERNRLLSALPRTGPAR